MRNYRWYLMFIRYFATTCGLIPSSVWLVTGQVCQCRIFIFVQPMGSKSLLQMTNKEREYYDQIHADNIWVSHLTQENTNIFISGSGASEKFKTLSRPFFRTRSTLAFQLSPIHLLTQSLKSSIKNVLKCTERIQDILKYEMRIKCTSQTLHIKIIAN